VNEAFNEQLDAVIRANRLQTELNEAGVGRPQPQTVHEEMLDTAAVILRGLAKSEQAAAWLRDYELYRETPAGFEYIWAPETDPRWELIEQPTKAYACRGELSCEEIVVARINRRRDSTEPPSWWRYCAGHLFGRRIVDGQLQVRTLVPKGSVR